MVRKYLGNKNPNKKEIHEYAKMKDACKLKEIKEEHKFWLDYEYEVEEYCKNKGYDGCKWCLPKYHTD